MTALYLLIILRFSGMEQAPPPQEFATKELCEQALRTLRAEANRRGYTERALVAACVQRR